MYISDSNQNIKIYFSEIRRYQNLDKGRERELFTRLATGDMKARDEIFQSVAKYAISVAKSYTGNPMLLEDLIQEANIGVLTAMTKFDINLSCGFLWYAKYWMRVNICKALDENQVVHQKNGNLVRMVKNIKENFFKEFNRYPEDWEVLGILEGQGTVVKDMSYLRELCMVEMECEDEDGDVMENTEVSKTCSQKNSYEDEIEKEDLQWEIRKKMRVLTDREKKLVMMNFGIGGYEAMEYEIIADRVGLCKERVRQIITGALKKMR